jgi:hypothetical protein
MLEGTGYAARQALGRMLVLLWPAGYLAYRLLSLRWLAAGKMPLLPMRGETESGRSELQQGIQLIFLLLPPLCLLFFALAAGPEVLTVMRGQLVWGVLAALTGSGFLVLLVMVEYLHQRLGMASTRDQITGYRRIVAKTWAGGIVGAMLMASAVLWLWLIGRAS